MSANSRRTSAASGGPVWVYDNTGTLHFRQHRMHKMQTIATVDPGICQSFCHAASRGLTVQIPLNGSRSCVGWRLLGTHGTSGFHADSMRPLPNYFGYCFFLFVYLYVVVFVIFSFAFYAFPRFSLLSVSYFVVVFIWASLSANKEISLIIWLRPMIP